jgi:aspartate/methionine/tyrosine aminotransferase
MNPPFSTRTNWNLRATPYALAVSRLHAQGKPVFDLTASNPTACGFAYDTAGILAALSQPESLHYDPDPRGVAGARAGVAEYYAQGAGVSPPVEQIFLTTSTSEAYSYLFRLHCDPDSEVLIAQPSYPLFEFLADLDDVRLVGYPLFYDHGWHMDLAALESRITERTRAVAVVHPNNPTGHFTGAREREALQEICRRHSLVLIVDEVFLDYALADENHTASASFAAGPHPVLTYVLSGLSKIAGLPQMKAAWIVAFGPDALLAESLARLEIIADTFLSMNASVQHALPQFLAGRGSIQRQIRDRVRANLAALDARLAGAPAVSRLAVEAGWYAVLRVPALESGESLAIRLLEQEQVIVHPGYFYGFDGDGWLVVSLLTPSAEFSEGIERLLRRFSTRA